MSSDYPLQGVNIINATSPERNLYEPTIFYTISEVIVAIFAIVGNSLVITVFWKERRLRRRTNYYIVSLAAADLLVGLLGIPFALLASIGLPTNLHACLFTVSLLVVLCTISIFCLVAVSVDRYWAILHPMGYSRHVRTKTALVIISICWFAGCFIGFLPLMGWHQNVPNNVECYFLKVMDHNYLAFLYIVTIITPFLLLVAFYAHIYRVVLKQLRQIVTMNPGNNTTTTGRTNGGTMLRMLGDSRKREVKATQNLSIIVFFFMICWIPLYTMNFILAFCANCFEVNSTLLLFFIILSHLNSAGNPLLYAYHLRDFRAALQIFFYKLFGLGHPTPMTARTNGRLSLPPSAANAFKNHYNSYRAASLRETRSVMTISQQSKLLTDSQLSLACKLRKKSQSLPMPPKISSIVTKTAALAAVPTGENVREIWKISEDPSMSEENSHQSKTENNGNVNSCYVVEAIDSDVCLNCSRASLPNCNLQNSSSDCSINSSYEIKKCSLSKTANRCLSSSSPQLTRNLFFVEAEMYDTHSTRCPRSVSLIDEKTIRASLHNCSPIKIVSDFFRNRNTAVCSKVNNTKDNLNERGGDNITENFSRNKNGIGVN